MAFNVVIDLVPPQHSNLVIGGVQIIGEVDKPNASTLPGGNQKLAEKLHACHIMAWKIICAGIAQQITGATLRDAAKGAFGFNDFQANNVNAAQIKEFMEQSIKATLKKRQADVSNYYAGAGRPNMSGGGKMGQAIKQLNAAFDLYQRSQLGPSRQTPEQFALIACQKQIDLFRAGYDESPFHSNEEKALARGEYVAFWYQIYHGGEPDSTRLAKFLIETPTGQLAIDNLIKNGS
jgi:hypothetical protein